MRNLNYTLAKLLFDSLLLFLGGKGEILYIKFCKQDFIENQLSLSSLEISSICTKLLCQLKILLCEP